MSKPFNIHDWQAKQRQQRLDEQYYVTVNRGRGSGKRLVRSAESDYEEPRVFSSYGEAEAYVKQAKSGGATPGQIASYWVSDENMNRIEDPVVAKGDGLEITQDEMERLHRNGRVRLKDGSLLVFPSKPLNVKEDDIDEASMTGTGASFTAGTGAAYATPNAFGDDKKKKMKTYKSIGYKKV